MRNAEALLGLSLLMLAGCKATPPGKLETKVMTVAKHRVLVRSAKEKNPLPANAETLSAGKGAFGHYCVACHGMDGQNTGVPFVLSPPAPSLASSDVQSYTDGQLK